MAKTKVWMPISVSDLPVAVREGLRLAIAQSGRNWQVCEPVILDVPESSDAELARLREQIRILERLVDRQRKQLPAVQGPPDILSVVKEAVTKGQLVHCDKQEYPEYRQALHKVASQAIENRQSVYHNIALNEVKRLDRLHGYKEDIGDDKG